MVEQGMWLRELWSSVVFNAGEINRLVGF